MAPQVTLGCNDIFGQDPPPAYGFGGNSTNILASFMMPPDGLFTCS